MNPKSKVYTNNIMFILADWRSYTNLTNMYFVIGNSLTGVTAINGGDVGIVGAWE